MEDCTVTTQVINEVHHTFYNRNGIIVAECRRLIEHEHNYERWYRDGKLHRDDAPAEIRYKNGQLVEEYWYHHGDIHRDDGPAVVSYKNGQKTDEWWYRDDKLHREDGPACIEYKGDQKFEECWYRDDKLCPIGVLASVVYQDIDSVYFYWTDDGATRNIDKFRDAVKGDAIHDALRLLPLPIQQAIIPHYCYQ